MRLGTTRFAMVCLSLPVILTSCVHPGTGAAGGGTPATPAAPQPVAVHDVADVTSDAGLLKSKVTRVTVYSDRARVTRQAVTDVPAKPTVFAFRGLPGWVDDGTVQVGVSAGRIIDVRVDRRFLAEANDASWRKLDAEHKAIADKMAALRDEIAVLDSQRDQIEAMKSFSLAKVTQDKLLGEINVKSYKDVLQFVSDSLRDTASARRKTQHALDELVPEYDASTRRLADAAALMKLEETTVLVTVQVPNPMAVTIELTYMLPGVTWEPMHELRASTTDQGNVELGSFAALTQTTGEDWGGAEISFSTQSTTQSVRIPELEQLTLGDTQTATRILTSQQSSFTRAQVAFQGQSGLWNKVHQASEERARANFEEVYRSNIEYLQIVQGRTVSLFEQLEKRGTTAHFRAQPAQSVRGDGHPVILPIGRTVLPSTQELVAAPEQSLNAARTVAMVNSTGQPLLPGKVALYQDGTFLGLTDIDFVAGGERFSLYMGTADQLKLSREMDRKMSSLVRKTRNLMQVVFVVTVENLSDKETSFKLADRIPVSENKEIKIDNVAITPNVKPDSQGLLHWSVTLKPGEKREFRIGYQVEYPSELVLETRRRQEMEKAMSPAPASAKPRAKKIEEQLLDLENDF